MKANPPDIADLMRRADANDRFALERLYGHAAAWLRDGTSPPEPMCSWLAARLLELSKELAMARRKDPSKLDAVVSKAMKVRRKKRGKPARLRSGNG